MSTLLKAIRFVVGLVFLLSGLLKATDVASFADIISQYGYIPLSYVAPLIVLAEICVGVMLILNIRARLAAISALVFLIVFSIIYSYGLIVMDITECGCFGPVKWLNNKPWLTFTRNSVLIILLLPVIFKHDNTNEFSIVSIMVASLMVTAAMFMCGFSFRGAKCTVKETAFTPIPLSESPLSSLVTCNPDSTYLVFAFSYNCPYCQNSIGNVNQFTTLNAVDKVIGIALQDSVAKERFNRLFETNFEIREIAGTQMISIARTLPTTFYLKNDSIMNQQTGMVNSPAIFMK